MALFALVFAVVALILIGVGFALGLVGIALMALLIALGVVSSSVAVGIRSGRAAAGFRAFVLQCGVIIGLPAGAVCAYLAHAFFQAYGDDWRIIVGGALGGAFAGLLIALLFDFATRKGGAWIAARLPSRFRSKPPVLEMPAEDAAPRPRRSGILR